MADNTTQSPQATNERESDPEQNQAMWGGDDFHYRALFEQAGDSVFIIGLELKYIAVNQQAANMLGYTQDELIGKPVNDIMAMDESSSSNGLMNEGSNLLERILRRKDGTTVPVEISTSLIYDEEGIPVYIQSIARDISERKRIEQSIQLHNRILAAISAAAARLLRSSNIETSILEVLASLGNATGVSDCMLFETSASSAIPTAIITYSWNKQGTIHTELQKVLEIFLTDIERMGAGIFIENARQDETSPGNLPYSIAIVPINTADLSWGYLALIDSEKEYPWLPAQRDAIQTSANLIGAALQRNRFEDRIRESEARNRAIIDALPDLVIRIDASGKILDYSALSDHPLFINRDVVTGKMLSEIWPKTTVKKIIRTNRKHHFTTPHILEEFKLPFSDKVYESRLNPISPREALILIREITLQAELKQMKSDFINRASHELRTPLTSAMLMVELIQGGGQPEELEEYWQILNSELNRQKILIDRLLITGRLENGMMRLEIAPTDLLAILNESITAIKPIANKKKISIELSSPEDLPKIMGDKSGLQQVFINLINNATKFSPGGSTVKVMVINKGAEVQVAVIDQGMGIPPQDLPHLFERFYRARNVTIAEIPGSGVGLYIVKSILERLGGKIQLTASSSAGTTFITTLRSAV
jgi:PAS domain S-box-containing protein